VSAHWEVQRLLGGPRYRASFAGSWIGAQGEGAGLVRPFIQVGIASRLSRGLFGSGRASYLAFWTDTRRHDRAQTLFAVSAGDRIAANLSLQRDAWIVSIRDLNSGRASRFVTREEGGQRFDFADWLAEDPGASGAHAAYPTVTALRMTAVRVNGGVPPRRGLLSTWLSANGHTVGPTPLQADAFALRAQTVSAAADRFLRVELHVIEAAHALGATDYRFETGPELTRARAQAAKLSAELRQAERELPRIGLPAATLSAVAQYTAAIGPVRSVLDRPPGAPGRAFRDWFARYTRAAFAAEEANKPLHEVLGLPGTMTALAREG
jgi:hypothetical protein